jgi:hypothetical protein
VAERRTFRVYERRRAGGLDAREAASRQDWRREDGQATVELVAAIPALLLAALISLQLLAAGYALTLADGAAEAGALALAEGGSAAEAAREALPGWADDNVSVAVKGGEVSVRLRPPSPFGSIADHLAVTSTASARSAE